MQADKIRAAVAVGIALLMSALPARAALTISGPTQVAVGSPFDLNLLLNDAYAIDPGHHIDWIDFTVTWDAGRVMLTNELQLGPSAGFFGPQFAPTDLPVLSPFTGTGVFVDPPTDALAAGGLVDYQFVALAPGKAHIEVLFAPTEVFVSADGSETQNVLPTLTVARDVEVVPEPAPWLAAISGFMLLFLARARAWGRQATSATN